MEKENTADAARKLSFEWSPRKSRNRYINQKIQVTGKKKE